MLTRDQIINHLTQALEPLPYTHAFWLEGADSSGWLDEYSDFDFNLDVDDDRLEDAYAAVEAALAELAAVDLKYVQSHDHPKLRQRVYHLEGTSDYWMIDFVWQLHSRNPRQCCFVRGNRIEAAKMLFDKSGVVTDRPFDAAEFKQRNDEMVAEGDFRYTQHSRVLKYVKRGQLPEALLYYQRYVIEPLATLLRVKYAPANVDYGLIHISLHVPPEEAKKLASLMDGLTLERIEENLPMAQKWYNEMRNAL